MTPEQRKRLEEKDALTQVVDWDQHTRDIRAALARVDELEAALRKMQQWDMLNPPDTFHLADAKWLRKLIDDALRAE